MRKWFISHPESVGETYVEHLQSAFGFGGAMVIGGLACILHGLVPAWFVKTGSSAVKQLHRRMILDRRHPTAPDQLDFVI